MLKSLKILLFFVIFLMFFSVGNVFATDEYYFNFEDIKYISDIQQSYFLNNGNNVIEKADVYSDIITITSFNSSYQKIDEKNIDKELPTVGTVYSGENYNFIVFGHSNKDEDDNAEVIRVVKYSKNWDRISSCSISDINTVAPFYAGNCRLEEVDGKLIIHTAHVMYAHSDGVNHQANLTIEINESNMKLLYTKDFIASFSTGYVSHSFDQYIKDDNDNIYTLDLGDAYPRGIAMCRYDVSNLTAPEDKDTIYDIVGEVGNNFTGVSIGGFELSSDNCLVIGSSIRQIDNLHYTDSSNVFLTVTPKNDISKESTKTIWLTNNAYNGDVDVLDTYMVKIDDNKFAVMWTLSGDKEYCKIQMLLIDGNGNRLTDLITFGGMVSCDPILYNNHIIWYGEDSIFENAIFFDLNVSSTQKAEEYDGKGLINFDDFKNFEITQTVHGDFVIQGYKDELETLTLPYIDYPWIRFIIRAGIFKDCTNLKNVIIPKDYIVTTNARSRWIVFPDVNL